eukprot:g8877.t1
MKVQFEACFTGIFIAVAGLKGVVPSQGAKLGHQGSLRKSLCAELSQIFVQGGRRRVEVEDQELSAAPSWRVKMIPIRRALVSVSDKTGVVEFCQSLQKSCPDIEILSTGGTCSLLKKSGLAVTEISDYTGFPEMMDGRLKTLHPKVHGGILARRGGSYTDEETLKEHGIGLIDLIVVNLYPFAATVAKAGCTLEDAIENIDIGGPTMLRAAAKNWAHVGVCSSPDFYPRILGEVAEHGGQIGPELRFEMSRSTFEQTSKYDGMIAEYLFRIPPPSPEESGGGANAADTEKKSKESTTATTSRAGAGDDADAPSLQEFSDFFYTGLKKKQSLRYGENPHQKAALYAESGVRFASVATATQLQGKELSYNNIADADGALDCVLALDPSTPACVIVKHANPCGVAYGASLLEAYEKAFQTDPTSAFGGIIAVNQTLDPATAEKIVGNQFVEVLLAPAFAEAAKTALAGKKNVRALQFGGAGGGGGPQLEYKKIRGGLLVQTRDAVSADDFEKNLKVVTEKKPTEEEMRDLKFAWVVCQFVKSNAIVYAKNNMTYGVGAGQMSRVFSSKIACEKAEEAKLELKGSAMASDAFFPFRDGIDTAAKSGVSCIIQPGGSIRDQEAIDAANEHGIAMVFTGCRHFKH